MGATAVNESVGNPSDGYFVIEGLEVGADKLPAVLLDELDDSPNGIRIKLGPRASLELRHCEGHRQRRLIGSETRDRIEGVGNLEDPSLDRDIAACNSARVAEAVVALVVTEHDPGNRIGYPTSEELETETRVAPQFHPFSFGGRPRFVENVPTYEEFPDVVEAGCGLDSVDHVGRQLHLNGNVSRKPRGPRSMFGELGVCGLEDSNESVHPETF